VFRFIDDMHFRNSGSISFKQQYRHVYEHLQGIPNKSDYIAKAVEAYINGGGQSTVTYENIRSIVMEILQNQGGLPLVTNQPSTSQVEHISQEDAELIDKLFS